MVGILMVQLMTTVLHCRNKEVPRSMVRVKISLIFPMYSLRLSMELCYDNKEKNFKDIVCPV